MDKTIKKLLFVAAGFLLVSLIFVFWVIRRSEPTLYLNSSSYLYIVKEKDRMKNVDDLIIHGHYDYIKLNLEENKYYLGDKLIAENQLDFIYIILGGIGGNDKFIEAVKEGVEKRGLK